MDVGAIAWALVVASFFAIPLAVSTWALLDAARRPAWAWALSGRRQVVWMAVIMFATLTVIGGMIVSSYYLTRVRHDIAAAEEGEIG